MFSKGFLLTCLLVFSLIGLTIFSYDNAFAADKDISDIKKELQEIKKELDEIKKILSGLRGDVRPAPPAEATVSIDDEPFLGNKDAPVTIIEFSDYQCPFCARFFNETLPLLKKEYVETGKLKFVFRDFPLDFHQYAHKAAIAANCAGEQGKYWEMHDKLFKNQSAMQIEDLKGYARQINLNQEAFAACLDSGKYDRKIKKDIEDGAKADVTGTPTFFVGPTGQSKDIKGRRLVGAQPFDIFKRQIDEFLKKAASK